MWPTQAQKRLEWATGGVVVGEGFSSFLFCFRAGVKSALIHSCLYCLTRNRGFTECNFSLHHT
jgi:hypothetical protein